MGVLGIGWMIVAAQFLQQTATLIHLVPTIPKKPGSKGVPLDQHTETSLPTPPYLRSVLRDPGSDTIVVLEAHRTTRMADKLEVQQGTLALMILRTVEVLGPLHGYGSARRIEETSKNRLTLNYGTLYPALLKLEQEGFLKSEWGPSENNRRAQYYSLTAAGRKQLARATREWHQTA